MREADKNRLRRAIEHLEATVRHIDSFKWENRTSKQERWLNCIRSTIIDKKEELTYIIEDKIQ